MKAVKPGGYSPAPEQDLRSESDHERRFPFLFGTQYYRAPTPEPEFWRADLRAIRDPGFNEVKYLVQWRWSHRAPDRLFFR